MLGVLLVAFWPGPSGADADVLLLAGPDGAPDPQVKAAAVTLQMRCESYGYHGVVATSAKDPVAKNRALLKVTCISGITDEMRLVIKLLGKWAGKTAVVVIEHRESEAKNEQIRRPKIGDNLDSAYAPPGTRWFKAIAGRDWGFWETWDDEPKLCLREPLCQGTDIVPYVLPTGLPSPQGGLPELMLSKDAGLSLKKRFKIKSNLATPDLCGGATYLLMDGLIMQPVDMSTAPDYPVGVFFACEGRDLRVLRCCMKHPLPFPLTEAKQ